MMSSCNLEDDLFDDESVIEVCILSENTFCIATTKAMIDNDCTGYSFINSTIVRRVCETLEISSVELIKSRKMKEYDERMSESITHVICSKIIIRNHIESLTFMLIIKLDQHDIILEKS